MLIQWRASSQWVLSMSSPSNDAKDAEVSPINGEGWHPDRAAVSNNPVNALHYKFCAPSNARNWGVAEGRSPPTRGRQELTPQKPITWSISLTDSRQRFPCARASAGGLIVVPWN